MLSTRPSLWDFGALAIRLPAGTWHLVGDTAPVSPTDVAVAIGLGTWRFDRSRSKKAKPSEKPTMMVDCATLTGAARVALGTDLPALFCNDDDLAGDLIAAGDAVTDPMWRMPLFGGYRRLLESKVADINNAPSVAFGGAITAALYLKEFVPDDVPWAHFDMMAWNNMSRPGRPEGGEAQAARAIFAAIEKRITK